MVYIDGEVLLHPLIMIISLISANSFIAVAKLQIQIYFKWRRDISFAIITIFQLYRHFLSSLTITDRERSVCKKYS